MRDVCPCYQVLPLRPRSTSWRLPVSQRPMSTAVDPLRTRGYARCTALRALSCLAARSVCSVPAAPSTCIVRCTPGLQHPHLPRPSLQSPRAAFQTGPPSHSSVRFPLPRPRPPIISSEIATPARLAVPESAPADPVPRLCLDPARVNAPRRRPTAPLRLRKQSTPAPCAKRPQIVRDRRRPSKIASCRTPPPPHFATTTRNRWRARRRSPHQTASRTVPANVLFRRSTRPFLVLPDVPRRAYSHPKVDYTLFFTSEVNSGTEHAMHECRDRRSAGARTRSAVARRGLLRDTRETFHGRARVQARARRGSPWPPDAVVATRNPRLRFPDTPRAPQTRVHRRARRIQTSNFARKRAFSLHFQVGSRFWPRRGLGQAGWRNRGPATVFRGPNEHERRTTAAARGQHAGVEARGDAPTKPLRSKTQRRSVGAAHTATHCIHPGHPAATSRLGKFDV